MSRREEVLRYIEALGQEFVRREMDGHARKLRLYYLAVLHGLTTERAFDVDVHWSEKLVVDWLKVLGVSPFEQGYPRRPRKSSCSTCREARNQQSVIHTEIVFPGGAKVRCFTCGEVWVEPDR